MTRSWIKIVFCGGLLGMMACGDGGGGDHGQPIDGGDDLRDAEPEQEDTGHGDGAVSSDAGEIPTGPDVATAKLERGGGYLYATAHDINVSFTSYAATVPNDTVYIRMLDPSEVKVDLGEHELVAAFEIGPKSLKIQGSTTIEALVPRPLTVSNNEVEVAGYGYAGIDTGKLVPLDFLDVEVDGIEPTLIMAYNSEISGKVKAPGRYVLLRNPSIKLRVSKAPASWPTDGSYLDVKATMIFPSLFDDAAEVALGTYSPAMTEAKFMPVATPGQLAGTVRVRCENAGTAAYRAHLTLRAHPLFGGENVFGYSMTLAQDIKCVAP